MQDRGTLLTSLTLLSVLAAGSYWLAERARLSDPVAHEPVHEPDYFAENFNLTRMDDKGNALYTMTSKSMTHYPDDDSTSLVGPEMLSARPDQPSVHIRGDTGHVTSDAEQVELMGNVVLKRAGTSVDPPLEAYSSYMKVLPEQDIASTNKPVQVIHGGSKVWADSMEFNNTERSVKMNEGVHARGRTILEPHPRTAQAGGTKTKRQ